MVLIWSICVLLVLAVTLILIPKSKNQHVEIIYKLERNHRAYETLLFLFEYDYSNCQVVKICNELGIKLESEDSDGSENVLN